MTSVGSTTESTATVVAPRPRWLSPLLLGAIALVVAAAAVAIWFGVSWARAGNDSTVDRAKSRDEVARIASSAIVTFHTLDFHKADETLGNWEAASTGPLHDQVVGSKDSSKKTIEAAKTVAKPTMLSLAVTDLNEFDGTATVIAAVKVEVSTEGHPGQTPKYLRIQGSLQRTGSGWKLSGIGQVDFARS
jgi:Mce-associated membrane protein